MVHQDANVGVAFALVIGAGAATALGASVVFFPFLVKLASRRVLAGALGASAGVMLYVSFIDIFQKTMGYFDEAGNTPEIAFAYTTCCFFGGIVFMMIMDHFIHWLPSCHMKCCHRGSKALDDNEDDSCCSNMEHAPGTCAHAEQDVVANLEQWQEFVIDQHEHQHHGQGDVEIDATQHLTESQVSSEALDVETGLAESTSQHDKNDTDDMAVSLNEQSLQEHDRFTEEEEEEEARQAAVHDKKEKKELVHMGISTAVAIGLHNFPEGLAAFVAALGDVWVGFIFALAIAVHNIPEGLCVALPIYYGTGSRWKGFLWACLSGVSEPLGALLGWVILVNYFTPTVYAILFGIVAGMMVFVVIKELIPTAHRYDPEDTVVTYCLIGGMAVMAASLVLFVI